MKRIKFKDILLFIIPIVIVNIDLNAQPAKAWEFGAQGSIYNVNRVRDVNINSGDESNVISLELKSAAYTGGFYVGKEITNKIVIDYQTELGILDNKLLLNNGLGVQYRLGYYFSGLQSPYVDPFLRLGFDYIYQGNNIVYGGDSGFIKWNMFNKNNSSGKSVNHMVPIRISFGTNLWLNDKWGLRIEGGYSQTLRRKVASYAFAKGGIVYRFGGVSKKSEITKEYVEKIVEKEVIVIKEIEVEVEREIDTVVINRYIRQFLKETDFVRSIYFNHNSSELTDETEELLYVTAQIMQMDTDNRFLIQGYADDTGNDTYNINLSMQRANTVYNYLIDSGVPTDMIKVVGYGKRVANIPAHLPEHIRERDRRVNIEIINDMEYWDNL